MTIHFETVPNGVNQNINISTITMFGRNTCKKIVKILKKLREEYKIIAKKKQKS